jgi:antitoxin component YwqK of YwqJK toxin-antitoxin module
MRTLPLALVAASCALGACATGRTTCPLGTALARQVYSGGAEAEWCRRPDGARQGPEIRFYESGAELASGSYLDGAQSGVWRYRFNDGRNWRAERWDDGALIQVTIDPAVAHMSPGELEALGPTSSGIIKLSSHDPIPGRETRGATDATFVSQFPNGRPRVAGSYDAAGLRIGVWRFWFEDGRPSRELEFLDGVRERAAREWHRNGIQAADGSYLAGRREGRWRFWDERGQLTADIFYRDGVPVSAPSGGGMLPLEP